MLPLLVLLEVCPEWCLFLLCGKIRFKILFGGGRAPSRHSKWRCPLSRFSAMLRDPLPVHRFPLIISLEPSAIPQQVSHRPKTFLHDSLHQLILHRSKNAANSPYVNILICMEFTVYVLLSCFTSGPNRLLFNPACFPKEVWDTYKTNPLYLSLCKHTNNIFTAHCVTGHVSY